MTIFERLRDDHHTLRLELENLIEATSLLKRTDETRARGKEARRLLERLKASFLAHTRAEEAVFYDRLRTLPHRDENADKAIEEHHQIEEHLGALEKMGSRAAEWDETLSLLKNELESHLAEEEATLFPILELALEGDEAERLARDFDLSRDLVRQSTGTKTKKKTAPPKSLRKAPSTRVTSN